MKITNRLIIALFLFIFANTAIAAEPFTATVNKTNIAINETLELTLTLKDAKETDRPNLNILEKDFIINRSSQSSNVSFINGSTSSSKSWNIQIMPKSSGDLIIPSFLVQSNKGVLKTKEIKIKVGKATQQNSDIKIVTTISKTKPYVNESVTYKIQIISTVSFSSNEFNVASSEDFILEQIGDVKQYEEINNGIAQSINELEYILTPLKAGRITIEPAKLSGDIKIKNNRRRNVGFFGTSLDLFDSEYKPFSAQGKKITMEVKPVQTDLNSWLPLHSLQISEKWNNIENAKVGEPINRTITIVAVGSKGNQLPNNEYLKSSQDYKVYSDKPIIKDSNNKQNIPQTVKTLSYAIIPQQSGEITIEEITIPWFNVNKHKLEYAKLPKKVIKVAKSDIISGQPVQTTQSNLENKNISAQNTKTILPTANSKPLMAIIAILSLLLILAISYIFTLKKKLKLLTEPQSKKIEGNDKGLNIKSAKNINQLSKAINHYFYVNFNMAKNSSLEEIKQKLISIKADKKEKIETLFNTINNALYGGKEDTNLKECQNELIDVIKDIKTPKNKKKKDINQDLRLNP